jgi:outer membrane protein insertion porin family
MLLVGVLAVSGMIQTSHARISHPIEDIRVEGLRRIAAGTVFNYLPVQVGDTLDSTLTAQAVRTLYETGFFHEVELLMDGTTLVVRVVERPAIASITLSGNKVLDKDAMTEGLKNIGLAEGLVFNRTLLDQISQEVTRQYYALGYYGAEVETTVTPLERNRVDIQIDISEGSVARIKEMILVGNEEFSDKLLTKDFQTGPKGRFSWFSSRDKYSREKLTADIESLSSFNLDQGYLDFKVESTQVTLAPDKREVFVTLNLNEGKRYLVNEVQIIGESVLSLDVIQGLITIHSGDLYSQKAVEESVKQIRQRFSEEGYAFANVSAYPAVDEESGNVNLAFVMDAGSRVYVRRIIFEGNYRTQDEVMRREMRQYEGAWYSADKVERSRIRLQRLGFFEQVDVQTLPVSGATDQVDILFTIVERSSGSIQLTAGYSEDQGFALGGSLEQDNFLGSGNRFGMELNTSKANRVTSFDFYDPYFTKDGISRGYKLFYQETDTDQMNISVYATDNYGGNLEFGVPIREDEKIFFGVGYDWLNIKTVADTPQRIHDFIAANGDEFESFRFNIGWSRDSRNQYYFATSGVKQSMRLELTLPGSDLTYYKFNYRFQQYFPMSEKLTLTALYTLGYANGYKDTPTLPFFENYYAGGANSVRGFQVNSLGPKDPVDGEPMGGNVKLAGTLEVLMPFPLGDVKSVRTGVFVDAGNVYNGSLSAIEFDDLRFSSGVALYWLSPVGSVKLSLAAPLNQESGDKTKKFQFSLGTSL